MGALVAELEIEICVMRRKPVCSLSISYLRIEVTLVRFAKTASIG